MRPVFGWMARRTAASYGLVSEAIELLHEQRLGFEGNTQKLLLMNSIAASRYLKLLIVSLRPDLRRSDEGEGLVVLADFASTLRPPVSAEARSRVGYISDVLGRAAREAAKVRWFLTCVRENKSAIAQALDYVAEHLAETRMLLDAASRQAAGVNPWPRSA
jgi:hypothetical protein